MRNIFAPMTGNSTVPKRRRHKNGTTMPLQNYINESFQIERKMIVVTVFFLILNQMEILLVQNRKENCHHDHIPFNVN